jgi:hypothetical protein
MITVSRFKLLCSIIVVITVPVLIVTLSQNIVFRSSDIYLFYFNDSQVVDKINTSLSNGEMADGLASFMNSFRPEVFQIEEDTGYDLLGIFDARDSYNMLLLKGVLDISMALCAISAILTTAIYVYFIRNDEKKILRNAFKPAIAIGGILTIVQFAVFYFSDIRNSLFRGLGMRTLSTTSKLAIILCDDFWSMLAIFVTGLAIIVAGVVMYLHYRLTRPPRIFY